MTALTDEERWNLHTTLARRIAEGVEQFARDTHGHPASMGTHEQWQTALDCIVKGSRAVAELENHPFMSDEGDAAFALGMQAFSTYFMDLWD